MLQIERRKNDTIISANGELDIASSPPLDALIKLAERDDGQRIIVSLERVEYCYAAGLSVLALAHRRIGPNLIVVVPDSAKFRRVFEITGLSKSLQIVPSLQNALDVPVMSAGAPGPMSVATRKRVRAGVVRSLRIA